MAFDFLFRKKPSHPPTPPVKVPSFPVFMGAGCEFTDGKHILAGYQPHKEKPCISGLGGHAETGETYLQTAYRETIEEIFHVSVIPNGLIDTLIRKMAPKDVRIKKGYVILRFTFQDLEKLLKLCKQSKLQSPLYPKLPRNLFETIQQREFHKEAEISSLCLLPVVNHNIRVGQFIHPAFVHDIYEIHQGIRKLQTTG
jgi:hypothetical protein